MSGKHAITMDHFSPSEDDEVGQQWSQREVGKIVDWLEIPENLAKTKGKSGITKKRWMQDIAAMFPHRKFTQVYNKFDNMKRSYMKAVKMREQSGWGLSLQDLNEGNLDLRKKLETKCPFFFRLENIWGEHPNVRPPSLFDSAEDSNDPRKGAGGLSSALDLEDDTESSNSPEPEIDSDAAEPSTKNPNDQHVVKQMSSAVTSKTRRNIRTQTALDSDSDADRSNTRHPVKKKKSRPTTMGDAIMAFAEAKKDEDERRYDAFLRQLALQGETRNKELDIEREKIEVEREKIEVEREKNKTENRRLDILMMRLGERGEITE